VGCYRHLSGNQGYALAWMEPHLILFALVLIGIAVLQFGSPRDASMICFVCIVVSWKSAQTSARGCITHCGKSFGPRPSPIFLLIKPQPLVSLDLQSGVFMRLNRLAMFSGMGLIATAPGKGLQDQSLYFFLSDTIHTRTTFFQPKCLPQTRSLFKC
jgi:hypothetical protein